MLIVGTIAFVGTHFLLSHPLRAPLVAGLGERGFTIVYALVAFATLGLMAHGFGVAPPSQPAWVPGDAIWALATLAMWVASVLLAGSFVGNPALPAPDARKSASKVPAGVFRITRHPMMWAFALWGVVHILIAPRIEVVILCAGIIVLALVGARLQDGKKFVQMGDAWLQWRSRTSFVPFGRGLAFPGWAALIGGTVIWIVATWAHPQLGAPAAGIFRWI